MKPLNQRIFPTDGKREEVLRYSQKHSGFDSPLIRSALTHNASQVGIQYVTACPFLIN